MKFGPVPPKKLPKQDPARVLLLAEKWQRAAYAQLAWSEPAKVCYDFLEGRQWAEAIKAELRRQRRPHFRFNIIAPLVRLVLGYHRANKTDITFKPGQDMRASEHIATALSDVEKVIATGCHLEYVDTEVFLDGICGGRGWYDTRLSFETNDLGEISTSARDPFAIYPDPDADAYNLDESANFMAEARYVSLDEIEATFGKGAMELLRPFVLGQTPLAPISSMIVTDEISPVRTFGHREDLEDTWWDNFYSLVGDFVDTSRRTIRLIDMQWKVKEPRNVAIDLETGDREVLPDKWGQDEIEKIKLYAERCRTPLEIQRRTVERIQWTTFAGDLLLYDSPSYYDGFTQTGYFPYFRRGITRGMVEDLVDPQQEKNKRRNARIEIAGKLANGGWTYTDSTFTPHQERMLKKYGSSPGVNVVYKKGEQKPEPIVPGGTANAHKQLEDDADQDIKNIAGINEAALGQELNVQSGRAIQAKQRQAVLAIQMYMDNFKRSKMLIGASHLRIIQAYYTEPRLYRIMGKNGHFSQVLLNEEVQDPTGGLAAIKNDVTVGKYAVVIDDAPLSDTFLHAQFEEMLMLLEKLGPAIGPYLPMAADLLIDASSMPRKDEWIERIKAMWQANAANQQHQQQQGQQRGHAPHGGMPSPHQETPGPLGGGPVAANVTPFTQ
jgi:hypothetical protein